MRDLLLINPHLLSNIHTQLGKYLQLFAGMVLCFFHVNGYTQGTDLQRKITIDHLEREYLLHLPPGYSSASRCAVIFALHGGGGNYENTPSLYNLNAAADKHHFIVVYPNAINKSWCMKG
ncbi:MAG: hypothetical protein H7282_04505, partial [Cytophagaceae bacterium]|nr:hypothetical protein [Cytophagaceae bacterium]